MPSIMHVCGILLFGCDQIENDPNSITYSAVKLDPNSISDSEARSQWQSAESEVKLDPSGNPSDSEARSQLNP